MNKRLEHYIDPEFIYRFEQNPDVVRNEEDARRDGLNCISLAHLALKDLFGAELPATLLCAEMYADRKFFDHLDTLDDMRLGDLVWFGIENPAILPDEFTPRYEEGRLVNWKDFPIKHVAMSIGEQDKEGDELLLHATYYEGTNVVWPLSRFALYEKYRRVYGLSRLKR